MMPPVHRTFGAFGGQAILASAKTLAAQSHIPTRNLTLVDGQGGYAHNDPASAYPKNLFFQHLLPFLGKIARGR
jgi:hypothetical protein